jgi:peptidyl-Lys metalloendopeptidase
VSDLVERALDDQRQMLLAKLTELKRWSPSDRAAFVKWFGTTAEPARRLIVLRVARVLELNKNYSASNFRRANPHRPGVYAYVRSSQPSRVFLDRLFLSQPPTGEDSRAGTITHEMSHFTIVGGTKDHTYGTLKCKALALTNPLLALDNADNFEFWAEGAR